MRQSVCCLKIKTGSLFLIHLFAKLCYIGACFNRRSTVLVNIGNNGTVCFRNAGIAAVYAVCRQGRRSCKTGSFAKKDYSNLCVKNFSNRIFRTDTAVLYKNRSSDLKSGGFKSVKECGKNSVDIGFNSGRRKSV